MGKKTKAWISYKPNTPNSGELLTCNPNESPLCDIKHPPLATQPRQDRFAEGWHPNQRECTNKKCGRILEPVEEE